METMGASEAKTHFSAVLAALVPLSTASHTTTTEERLQLIERIRSFGRGRSAGGPIKAMIEEGRL
ncbi:MAG: hypothetical protein HYU66_24640 [Armatimonadetes bacterium]|nr:hypothetical protein [Armatimonadota bacterium]